MTESQKYSGHTTTEFLCGVIRGESVNWPSTEEEAFYEEFLKQSNYHGVDSLVCDLLKHTPVWKELPDNVAKALLQAERSAVAIEMARARDLISLNDSLLQSGISVLLLKGSALAYTHYKYPHLRTRVDTDIFIDSGDIHDIRELLAGLGYQLLGWIYKSHQFNARKSSFGGMIIRYDVHWRPNNRSLYARVINYKEAVEKSLSVSELNGCRTLSPVHTLLLACMHRAGDPFHDPDRLIWLYDIHLLMSAMPTAEQIDFSERAVRENIQEVCHDALVKSRHCFATNVPDHVLQALVKPPQPESFKSRFTDSQLALLIDDFRLLPDAKSRLEFLSEFLFPPSQYLLRRYGKKGWYWVPALYFRYLLGGLLERVTLR